MRMSGWLHTLYLIPGSFSDCKRDNLSSDWVDVKKTKEVCTRQSVYFLKITNQTKGSNK